MSTMRKSTIRSVKELRADAQKSLAICQRAYRESEAFWQRNKKLPSSVGVVIY